jgi:hypothetical protein
MTDPRGSSRRTFLGTSAAVGGALAGGFGFVPSVHARGNDLLKVGLIGCGGRGTGATENICEAAGSTYNIKIHAMADAFEDRAQNCFESTKKNPKAEGKFDVTPERVFVGLDGYQKVIDCCDLISPSRWMAPGSARFWPRLMRPRRRTSPWSPAPSAGTRPPTSRASR